MFLLYHAYVYLEFLILACTIYILAPKWIIDRLENAVGEGVANDIKMEMILNPDNVGSILVHVSSNGEIDITKLIDGIKQENEK